MKTLALTFTILSIILMLYYCVRYVLEYTSLQRINHVKEVSDKFKTINGLAVVKVKRRFYSIPIWRQVIHNIYSQEKIIVYMNGELTSIPYSKIKEVQ